MDSSDLFRKDELQHGTHVRLQRHERYGQRWRIERERHSEPCAGKGGAGAPKKEKRREPSYSRTVHKPVDNINDTRTPGQRLRKLLSMTGTTFGDFAVLSGIPNSSLSSNCSDKMPLRGDRLKVVADLLGVSEGTYHARGRPPCAPHRPSRMRAPGERIRKLLALSNTTVGDFAEMSGIPAKSLSSICTGKMRIEGDR